MNPQSPLSEGIAGFTSIGPRTRNEDRFVTIHMDLYGRPLSLVAIADGMGGEGYGDIAAQVSIDELARSFFGLAKTFQLQCHHFETSVTSEVEITPPIVSDISATITRINTACQAERERLQRDLDDPQSNFQRGLKSTLVAFLTNGQFGLLFWLGDSRAYRFRDGALKQLSTDHTVGVQVSRFLGPDAAHDAELRLERIQQGDIYVLCSDGVSSYCSESELENMTKFLLCRSHDPSDLAEGLVSFVGSTTADNATVVVQSSPPIAWPPPLMKPLDRSIFHLRHVTRAVVRLCFESSPAHELRQPLVTGLTKDFYYPGEYVCCRCGAALNVPTCADCHAQDPDSHGQPYCGAFIELADGDTLTYIPVPDITPDGGLNRILLGDQTSMDPYFAEDATLSRRSVRVAVMTPSFQGEILEISSDARWVHPVNSLRSPEAVFMLMPPKWKLERPLSLDKLFRGHVLRFKEAILRFVQTLPIVDQREKMN